MSASRPITRVELRAILQRLGDLTKQIILIGGQAVAFWAEHYRERAALATLGPVNSKDIDFCATRDQVLACAKQLGGRARLPDPFDPTPNTGIVEYVEQDGSPRVIDFLGHPYGLDYEDVVKKAVPVDILDDSGQAVASILVMHPVHCLESRVHNIAGLGRDNELNVAQLRASILCTREYLRDRLDAGAARVVLDLNERIFKFAAFDRNAITLFERHHIDPFDAILEDDRLPEPFRRIRLLQMREKLAERRARRSGSTD